ncbi:MULTISPECIES: hypothetical protein [unclassified Methylophaga]|jgi:hypothetical protein|uniref:hypothetical protein n=1 Tax=unclassified Methylophaga TaxID=2629249 RepID=UPI0025F960FF|nr:MULTISPECIES: hypothetical protein [unclassified Methylophaga]|tara:strand:+ start:2798 stop:2962 length:165 start_codon:yes stop_codon:yes gene_type:complete
MDTGHHDELVAKALADREELFRYADLKHPLIALLFNEASLDKLTPDESSESSWL